MKRLRFYSRGKVLITGEYVVLYGARALAVPSRLGQYLEVTESDDRGKLDVHSKLNDQDWFTGTFALPGFEVILTSNESVSEFVRQLFLAASELKPDFFKSHMGYRLDSTLEFDTRWGLGSSSSLISNLAWWMDIDPYKLFWKVSPGSGFDIACARSAGPIIYQMENGQPVVEEVDFDPDFKDRLYFVYLGNKQDSQYTVRDFRERIKPDQTVIREISGITDAMARAGSLEMFENLSDLHEELLAAYLGIPTVKNIRFPGFKGAIKSLGAWGGDLVMVTWNESEEKLRKYFETKGLKLIFRYEDLI